MHMQPVLAEKWSWKILNEYPEDLKNVIRKWAKDEQIPEIEYSRISLEMAMQGIGLDILEAVDLLYITSKIRYMGMKYLQDLRVDKEGSDMNVGIYQI